MADIAAAPALCRLLEKSSGNHSPQPSQRAGGRSKTTRDLPSSSPGTFPLWCRLCPWLGPHPNFFWEVELERKVPVPSSYRAGLKEPKNLNVLGWISSPVCLLLVLPVVIPCPAVGPLFP